MSFPVLGNFVQRGIKSLQKFLTVIGQFPLQVSLANIRQEMVDLLSLVHEIERKHLNDDACLEQSLQLSEQPTSHSDLPSPAKAVPEGWQITNDIAGQLEDEIMSEEPVNQTGVPENKNKGKDQESQTAGLRWQPLDALLPSAGARPEGGFEVDREIDHLTAQLSDLMPIPDGDLVSIFQNDERHLDPQPLEDQRLPITPAIQRDPFLGEDARQVSCNEDDNSLAETVMDTTFYLVPRLNDHYLFGELALQLREWFPVVCEIYGWELASLSVRPDYLKWTLLDFPECLIRDMLGVVRHWTSTRIFTTFPGLQSGNPTQDFWSPGYLVDTQNREFPTQMLITHVSRSRTMKESSVGSSFN
jgi:REP element-mobilizing transposase RayT